MVHIQHELCLRKEGLIIEFWNCIRVVPELNDQTLLEFVGQFTATLSRKDLQDLVTALQGRLDDFAAYDDLLGRTKQ